MSATAEFKIEGRRFEVSRLGPDETCQGLEVLGRVLGPAALQVLSAPEEGEATDESAAGTKPKPNYAAILQALLVNASQIAVLLKLFAPRAKFDRANNGILVELQPFTDEVFGGRVDLMIAFLFHAARAEYGCFLGGGSALASLLAQAGGSSSASPPAPTP